MISNSGGVTNYNNNNNNNKLYYQIKEVKLYNITLQLD